MAVDMITQQIVLSAELQGCAVGVAVGGTVA
jgi:hypothetical protein